MGPEGGGGADQYRGALPGTAHPRGGCYCLTTMPRWALLTLMVLTLGRTLLVPATPTPGFQLLPQNLPPATACPLTSESPSASTTAPSAAWGHPSPDPHPGPRIALSLDVPLGLLQILLEQARARAAREQAAANAHILAQVGRR